jgi:hypothetical protein
MPASTTSRCRDLRAAFVGEHRRDAMLASNRSLIPLRALLAGGIAWETIARLVRARGGGAPIAPGRGTAARDGADAA